jgi:hypothetical protein
MCWSEVRNNVCPRGGADTAKLESEKGAAEAALRVRSSSFGDARALDRFKINLQQGLVLLPLLLILLSQPYDLSNDLNVKAVALGLLKDLPLSLV